MTATIEYKIDFGMVDISIVIPTYNRADSLKRLLDSLKTAGGHNELIVVDDESDDHTKEVIDTSSATYVRGAGGGPTVARRIGAQHATGPVIGFLEDDHIVTNDYLDAVHEAFDRGERIVQVRVIQRDQGEKRHDVNPDPHISYNWNFRNDTKWNYGKVGKYIPFSLESGRFIHQSVLEEVPLNDPNLKADGYGESLSFAFRAQQQGYSIYFEPDSVIDHVGTGGGGSEGRFNKTKGAVTCNEFDYHKYHNLMYIHTRFFLHLAIPALLYHVIVTAGGQTVAGQYESSCLRFIPGGLIRGLLTGLQFHARNVFDLESTENGL